jgi:ankyrin repeat protein
MNQFPFNRLPNELKIAITAYLSPQDCARLGATCVGNLCLTYEFGKATEYDLRKAVSRTDNVELVKQMLKSGVNPSAGDNYAIQLAAEYGRTEIVRLLLSDSRVNPSARDNYAIRWAAAKGHTEVVELLLGD